MLIEVNSKQLHKALKIAAKIASKKTHLGSTTSVLLSAISGKLNVLATNLDVTFSADVECSVSKEGNVLVDAAKLTAFVGTYRDMPLVLKSDTKGGLSIVYNKSTHKLVGTPVSNFPNVEVSANTPFSIPTKDFAGLLKRTAYLAIAMPNRPHLSGVSMVIDKNCLRLTSTDTLRISSVAVKSETNYLVNLNTTIPRAMLAELVSILSEADDVAFGVTDRQCVFKCGTFGLSSTLNAQPFSDLRSMFVDGVAISINRALLLETLVRTSILSDKLAPINEFVFSDNSLTVKTDGSDGSSHEVIPVDGSESFSVHFRIKQIIEFLSSIETESIELMFNNDKTRFTLVEPSDKYDTRYLISPVRIS